MCSEVIVVTPPTGPEPDLPAGVDVRWVRDPVEHGGPLVGLATGLAEARTRWALVVAGDMPGLSPAVLREMVRIASAERAEAVALLAGVDLQPVPQGVSVDPALRSARALLDSGERSLRALLETLEVVPVDEPTWRALDPDGETLRDVDVPADLER